MSEEAKKIVSGKVVCEYYDTSTEGGNSRPKPT